jgi:tRNA (guanine37-N1)-methyltransferase
MIKNNIPRAFDVFGNIVLVKFPRGARKKEKKRFASNILKNHKSITTVLEKIGKFKGRLRKQETRWVLGEKTKEVLYRENNCVFRFNLDSVYFSTRLSNERKEIAGKIKKNDAVLVMFAGVAAYSIVIAKNSKAKIVYSNELNKEANKYGKLNAELNKVKNKIIFLDGDIRRVARTISKPHPPTQKKIVNRKSIRSLKVNFGYNIPAKFDVIVMPRPQLKDSFLKEAFLLSKKGTRIFYYDFCKEDEIPLIENKIKTGAGKARKKIKILRVKKAGEIAPYKYRIRIDFMVLN